MKEYFFSQAGLLFLDPANPGLPFTRYSLTPFWYLTPSVTLSTMQPNPALDNPLSSGDKTVHLKINRELSNWICSFFSVSAHQDQQQKMYLFQWTVSLEQNMTH